MLSKLPKSKKTLENVGPEANREKTTMKLKHINFEPILEAFWPHFVLSSQPSPTLVNDFRIASPFFFALSALADVGE